MGAAARRSGRTRGNRCACLLGMKSWSTDLRHLPPESAAGAPRAVQANWDRFRALAEAGTSRPAGSSWRSAVRCGGRVGRRRCNAWLDVRCTADLRVEWRCGVCGEQGVITGIAGGPSDLSRYLPRGKLRVWGYDEEERRVLVPATVDIPNLRAVLARGTPRDDVPGLIVVEATVDELDEMYSLVEELTDATRSRARMDLLDGVRQSLSTSMDGF